MLEQQVPLYGVVWYPAEAKGGERVDDSPYLVLGWTHAAGGLHGQPIIVALGGHCDPPRVWSYPVKDEDPTLDLYGSEAEAERFIRSMQNTESRP